MRKHAPKLAALAVAALALAGCGGAGSATPQAASGQVTGDVTLQTWSLTPKFTDYLNEVIAGFEAKYPGTKVKLVDQPGDGYSDKVLTQASSGTLPDVVNLPPDFALPLAKQGMLLDISTVDKTLQDTYVAGGLSAFEYKGVNGVFGYPWYLNTDVSYWNTDKLDANGLDAKNPPKTTADLFAQAKTMHDASGGKEYLISRKPGLDDFTRGGIDILAEDGKTVVFNTDKAAAMLDQYRDAFKAGYMPPTVLNNDYLGNSKLFGEGKVAWTTGGGNSIPSFEKDNPSLAGKVVATPSLDSPPLYVQGLGVSAKSKNQPAAIALAQWVTNAENQGKFAHLVNIFPSTKSSASDPYFAKSDGTPASDAKVLAFKELETAKNLQPYEINGAMSDILSQQIALAIKGDVSSKAALDDAASKINQMLARG
ncbi:ABC transporter substrate-binding protein [Pseudarthrobacter sp. P1]|uniref:ABC transporter substrate-binding protein n=1 Tax=Pseudarthrobacter sp. P1 TaxID=3418418 RepID=UPI003CE9F89C